mgnify:CR=1 FL=1
MNDDHFDLRDCGTLLRRDAPLVAKVLQMANSSVYSPVERVGSLEQAISIVGLAEIYRLVGMIASNQLADQTIRLYPIEASNLRFNTLFVALLMEEMAKFSGESPRRCYVIGLLRPIGMATLEIMGRKNPTIVPFQESGAKRLDEWEQEVWGTTNVIVAEQVLKAWNLPLETVVAIRHHYAPEGMHCPIVHILHLAATAAYERGCGIEGEEGYWNPSADTLAKAGLSTTAFQMACQRASESYARMRQADI